VRFDGIDDLMTLSGTITEVFRNRTGASLFGAVSCATGAVNRQRWFYASTSTSGNSRFVAERNTSNQEQFLGRRLDADSVATIVTPTQTYSADSLAVVSAIADYSVDTIRMYQNGVAGPSTNVFQTGSTGQPLADTASGLVLIGAGLSVSYWVGSLAEIIVYPRTVTEVERTAIESYLKTKWSIA
jgi:hypothetical protein